MTSGTPALIAKGVQQYEVMEHLGHPKIATTTDTYGHLFPNVRERIRRRSRRHGTTHTLARALPSDH